MKSLIFVMGRLLFGQPVANHCVYPVITSTEAPELHLLPILDLLRIAVSPLHWHIGVCVCIN